MSTQRIAIALAAATLAGSAFAQDAQVTLYGRMYLSTEAVKASGVAAGQDGTRTRVSNNSSLFGIRGTESLGGGLQAWFQLENAVTADAGGGTIAGRNTGVGITEVDLGTIMMGMWDSPYKTASPRFDPFSDLSIASQEYIIGQLSSIPGQPFKIRIQNSVQWWSPQRWSPLDIKLAVSANEGRTGNLNPWIGSALVGYSIGNWYADVSYEVHKDSGQLVANNKGNDDGVQAGLQYTGSGWRLGGIWERLTYRTDANGGRKLRRDGVFIGGNYFLPPFDFRASYGHAWDLEGNNPPNNKNDTGADMFAVGVAYVVSKRTEVVAYYSQVSNQSNGQYQFGLNPIFAGANITAGADSRGFMVGIRHLY